MKTRRLILSILAAAACAAAVARTAAEFFVDAPNSTMMLFDKNLRMDMLDYFRAGQLRDVSIFDKNGGSHIVALNDSSLSIVVGKRATIQFAVLPVKNDTLIAIVETVATPTPDSSIAIYNPSDPSNIKNFDMPGPEAFIRPEMRKAAKGKELPPFMLASAVYEPDTRRFILTPTIGGYYTDEDRPETVSMMVDRLVWAYKDGRFVVDNSYRDVLQ